MKPILTNLIIGVLGAGKTSAIQSLLDQKPADERWAILINEYGQVAIDNALIDPEEDIDVMELASGCVCCTLAYAFEPLLAQLIRRVKPHRLIIEPSGAGHPARIIDMLRGEKFGKVLDLRATLCIVDPADFQNPRVAESELFRDQLHMADSVVISWIDRREPEQIEYCREQIAELDPPKQHVYETQFGRLKIDWLDAPRDSAIDPRYSPAHQEPTNAPAALNVDTLSTTVQNVAAISAPQVQPSSAAVRPRRFANHGNGQWACGWIYDPAVVFEKTQLLESLESLPPMLRVKGIFHCADDWWAVNIKGRESSMVPVAYRSDSRLEIIADQPQDWDAIEALLQACVAIAHR